MNDHSPPACVSRRALLRAGGLAALLHAAPPRWRLLGAAPQAATPECRAVSRTSFPPLLEKFIAHLDARHDEFPSERYAEELAAVLSRWSEALRRPAQDRAAIGASIAPAIAASALEAPEEKTLRRAPPVEISRRSFGGRTTTGRESFLKSWTAYLAPFSAIRTAEFEIYRVRIESESPAAIETRVRYDLVGDAAENVREQRTGSWTLEWVRDSQQRWMVRRWTVHDEVRSRVTGNAFVDITGSCLGQGTPAMLQLGQGLDHWRTVIDGASGIDVYGNNGIAVGDIDGSGFDSIYVCQPAGLPNRLLRNRGDGTFEDVTERSGVGILDGTASAVFADFRNQGRQDLLVVGLNGPLLFENQGGGRFEYRQDAFRFNQPPQGTFTTASVADYNRDGLLDVYFCVYSFYQGLSQYQFPWPYYDAQNGPPNYLFRNRGDGTFEDVTAASGLDQNNNRYSFGSGWCDFDGDGWPDLYVANDFGRKNLYRNRGDGTFTDMAAKAGVEDYGPGMSVCWLDYDNDGRPDLYVANMWLASGRRITTDDRFLRGTPESVRAIYRMHTAGNSLFHNEGNGTFKDVSLEAGANIAKWSWSCTGWDFDHDGYTDLYVANGFVSGPNRYDLTSFFWRQVAQRSMSTAGAHTDYELAWNAINELLRSDYTWDGYARKVFFANNRDGTFSEMAGAVGLDFLGDGRAFALSDFNHDGRLEIALKSRTGPQLRILRNDLEPIGNAVSFRLTGVKSNRDAIGAVITVETAAGRQTKFIEAGAGFASQHTRELFFGLGAAEDARRVAVRWPGGLVQEFANIPANHRIEIEEGRQEFRASAFQGRRLRSAPASPAAVPAAPAATETWMIQPLFGPGFTLPDLNGTTHSLSGMKGRPVLLSFWRMECPTSQQQLVQLQALAGGAPAVLAINLDDKRNVPAIAAFARRGGIQFPILLADEATAASWNIFYQYLFDRRREMGTPTSLLVDESGAVIKVYRGFVEPARIAADWKSAPRTAEERLARALPFPGRFWASKPHRDYFTYGIAYIQHGYLDQAQEAFQHVIAATPGYADAWFNLGTIYLNRKMYAEARRHLNEALRLNPQDADAWNNLGMISGEEGKYDEAAQDFREAVRLKPGHVMAMQNLVQVYRYQGRLPEAQKVLEESIRREPDIPELHFGLAMLLSEQNNLDAAREEFDKALRLKPDDPETLNNLGVVLLRLGRLADALERFERCRKVAPDFDRSYLNLATVYRETGRKDEGRRLLREYLAAHPDNEAVKQALGQMN